MPLVFNQYKIMLMSAKINTAIGAFLADLKNSLEPVLYVYCVSTLNWYNFELNWI